MAKVQALAEALQAIAGYETAWSRDNTPPWGIHEADPPPYNRLYGPVYPRGGLCALVFQHGECLAHLGDVHRSDLTFSVAKTYLALLAGVAHDQGLLPDVHEAVFKRCPGIGFDTGRLQRISWEHLLQQTSEWEGTCLGIPEQVDRYRWLSYQPGEPTGRKGDLRPLQEPGSYFEYNDVRINQLSLALLHLFKRPLPEVFEEAILKACDCSDPFRWDGYAQGLTAIDGKTLISVPGGSHWGGGVSISAMDQARIGLMMMRQGKSVRGKQVLSAQWIEAMQRPCAVAPFYGYLVWLYGQARLFSEASPSAWFALGAGSSVTWVDPSMELVVVLRWIDAQKTNDCIGMIMRALLAA
ncbi:MAG: class C beta-lactamase-related serine hydrolase [Betaproteobacteria bacterium]|nr:class C beta-lactamase-related serine hydrolase [Betaproteobacteria bacterium]